MNSGGREKDCESVRPLSSETFAAQGFRPSLLMAWNQREDDTIWYTAGYPTPWPGGRARRYPSTST